MNNKKLTMIAVTGATGKLGGLVLDGLLKTTPPNELVAFARSPKKAEQFASRGVQVRHGDYDQPRTLAPALGGVNRLLLVSGMDMGKRVDQHRAVIEAAKVAGVGLLAYTSVLRADSSTLPIADEHKQSEELICSSGIPYVILRNGWYIENYTDRLDMPLAHGAFIGAAQNGRIAAASRADYAAAAVEVLTTDGPPGQDLRARWRSCLCHGPARGCCVELGCRRLPYKELPASEYRQALTQAHMPEWVVELLVATDLAVARGDLDSDSRDLHTLIGCDTQTLRDVLANTPKP